MVLKEEAKGGDELVGPLAKAALTAYTTTHTTKATQTSQRGRLTALQRPRELPLSAFYSLMRVWIIYVYVCILYECCAYHGGWPVGDVE